MSTISSLTSPHKQQAHHSFFHWAFSTAAREGHHLIDNSLGRSAHSHTGPSAEQEHEHGAQQAPYEHLWDGYVHLRPESAVILMTSYLQCFCVLDALVQSLRIRGYAYVIMPPLL